MCEICRAVPNTAARERRTPTGGAREHGAIDRILVAVPARDEWTTIVDCLDSIDAAATVVGLPTRIVVAADSCRDATASVVRRYAARHRSSRHGDISVVEGRWGGAGAARRAAVDAALCDLDRAERVWIANTDADTTVPAGWLRDQVLLAARHQAVAGVVDLDPAMVAPVLLDRFRSTYRVDGDRHTHVHGANLGVRADVYRAAGGWCAATVVGEDHGLWSRIVAVGASTVHSAGLRVITSGRTNSRVDGGFASDLDALVRRRPDETDARQTDARRADARQADARQTDARERPASDDGTAEVLVA